MPIGTRIFHLACVFFVLLVMAGVTSATTTTKAKSKHAPLSGAHTSSRQHSSKHSAKTVAVAHSHGQHGIDEDRTIAIQSALIRERYLLGEPTGVWDEASKEAMLRYQSANGWQTKITPDSRALIKLGLGPDHKGLLNPETASIPSPHELGVDSETQPGGAADQQ